MNISQEKNYIQLKRIEICFVCLLLVCLLLSYSYTYYPITNPQNIKKKFLHESVSVTILSHIQICIILLIIYVHFVHHRYLGSCEYKEVVLKTVFRCNLIHTQNALINYINKVKLNDYQVCAFTTYVRYYHMF